MPMITPLFSFSARLPIFFHTPLFDAAERFEIVSIIDAAYRHACRFSRFHFDARYAARKR
jgi:hypothetical protein